MHIDGWPAFGSGPVPTTSSLYLRPEGRLVRFCADASRVMAISKAPKRGVAKRGIRESFLVQPDRPLGRASSSRPAFAEQTAVVLGPETDLSLTPSAIVPAHR
jgi:hypothetical protein